MLPAYIYARFSTLEQSKGDSLERQIKGARAFIEAQGWLHSLDREMIDEGKSAFHGVNRNFGSKLYDFEQKANSGHFANGAVLVLESVDRASRQGYEEAFDFIKLLTRLGVTVATWQDGQIYRAGERLDMGKAMLLIAKSELAHEESSKKSKRLKAAWASKIAAVQNGDRKALTSQMPGWLTKGRDGNIEAIPHRVAVLNELFDWYIEGRSLPWIVRTLNERDEPNWGRGNHGGKGWNVSTVHKYLTNRQALGEYQPKVRDTDGNAKLSRGFIVPDFYPQAVLPDKFDRVQNLRKLRKRWTGGNPAAFRNLFKGIAACASCGGPLHLQSQSKPGTIKRDTNKNGTFRYSVQKTSRSYLHCKNATRRYGCKNRKMIRYECLEVGILDALFLLANRDTNFAPDSKAAGLQSNIAEQERLIKIKQEQLETVTENLMTVVSKALAEKASQLENELEADRAAVDFTRHELSQEIGAARPEDNIEALLSGRADLNSEDEDIRQAVRGKTNLALRGLINAMECDENGETHVRVGNNALYLHFDTSGQCTGVLPGQNVVYAGPNGEIDWHPDRPDAEYEYDNQGF